LEPLISVIVCAWNEELYIQTCIRSLLNQKIEAPFEIILVNDCSTDSTLKIMENYRDTGIVKIKSNLKNMGIGYTSNVGIRMAHGRYVVRVDADDYVSEYFLQTLFLAMNDMVTYKAVSCDYHLVSKNGEIIGRKKFPDAPIACGIMFEKEALIDIGLYNDDLRVFEERELLKRFLGSYQILNLPISLYRYRIHEANTSRPTLD
jgi:glycosyltransferase involved in cell wall biosynthesis